MKILTRLAKYIGWMMILLGLPLKGVFAYDLSLPDSAHCTGSSLTFSHLNDTYHLAKKLPINSVIGSQQILNATITCTDSAYFQILLDKHNAKTLADSSLFITNLPGIAVRLRVDSHVLSPNGNTIQADNCLNGYVQADTSNICQTTLPSAGTVTVQLDITAELVKYADITANHQPIQVPLTLQLTGGPARASSQSDFFMNGVINPQIILDEETCTQVLGMEASHDFGAFNLASLTSNGPLNNRAHPFTVTVADCPVSLTTATLTLNFTRQPGSSGFFVPVENTGEGKGIYITLNRGQTYGDIIPPGGTLQSPITDGVANFNVWAIPYYFSGGSLPTAQAGSLHSVVDVQMSYQ